MLAGWANVIAVYRTRTDAPQEGESVTALQGDITDSEFIAALPSSDIVVHLAAATPHGERSDDPVWMRRVNCEATVALLEYASASKVRRFLYASTGSIYLSQPSALSEDAPLAPKGHYSLSKRVGEMYSALYVDQIPDVVVVRLFHPYGPRQAPHYLVPRLISRVIRDEPIPVPSLDGPRLTMIYIDDLVDVLRELVLGLGPDGYKCFNVGTHQAYSVPEVARKIGDVLGKEPRFEIVEGPVDHRVSDVSALQSSTRSRPQVDLAEGIARTVAALD